MRSGQPIPRVMAEAPELTLGLQLYMDAWYDLSTCRSSGMSAGPIPWLAIYEWATLHELDEDQRELLHAYIPAMDATYFEHLRHKQETEGNG